MFHTTKAGDVVVDDELKLSELNRDKTVAPYHIINTALNLTESRDHNLRGRDADFFFFSKNFIGSATTGYVETKRVERFDHHLNLGTAMAISAAAAAPNAGQSTPKSLKFVMTLLNIRLGYWIPNPAWVGSGSWRHRPALHIGANPWHLLKEAVGKLNAHGSHVNVSDGGHIENLAIYELLRRRCKLIIAIDGEADPTMTFKGLATVLRFARIDMGIAVDGTLDEIRKDDDGMSQKHYTVGTIHYGKNKKGVEEIGYLLYIKSSMTGDEPEYLRAYRAHKESFPHESTADQFFTETQFEAYRALGDHIAETIQKDTDTVKIVDDALPRVVGAQ